MAIVFDAAAAAYRGTAATSHTFSFTVGSNANRAVCLFVHVFAADDITGITYAGTSMTQINKVQQAATGDWGYIYYLSAPTSGANNFVVSHASARRITWAASSYDGVNQTGQPEANNSAGGTGTTAPVSATSITNAAFHVYGYIQNAASTDSYTNVTQRAVNSDNGTAGIGDQAKDPAGVLSQAANWTGSQAFAANVAVLAPTAAAGPTNLKTYNGLAKASVKTIDGLAIASIKTFNGLT